MQFAQRVYRRATGVDRFLAPAHEGDRLVAEAKEVSLAGRSGIYSITVRNGKGEDIAVFQGLSRAIGGVVIPMDQAPNDAA